MNLEFACRVEQGRRQYNDDRAMICGKIVNLALESTSSVMPEMAAVCDGCGGYYGGGIAAQIVLNYLAQCDCGELLDEKKLAAALEEAEKRINEGKNNAPQYSEMCTTVAGCVFGEEKTVIFHSGDSRVYRFDGRMMARMTTDHSAVQELVDMGLLTREDAASHPNRNIIRRAMGLSGLPPEIYVSHAPITPGEIYLICSDGLWECMSDSEIGEVLSTELNLQEKADELVNAALEADSDDNISVVLCKCQGEALKRSARRLILD